MRQIACSARPVNGFQHQRLDCGITRDVQFRIVIGIDRGLQARRRGIEAQLSMVARASSSSISLVAAVLAGLLVSSTYAVTQEKKWTGIGCFKSQDHKV